MSMIQCPCCGLKISDRFRECFGCGQTIVIDPRPVVIAPEFTPPAPVKPVTMLPAVVSYDVPEEKKHSVLSILSLALLPLFPAAFVVSLIDLAKKDVDTTHRHGLSFIALYISALLLYLALISPIFILGQGATEKLTAILDEIVSYADYEDEDYYEDEEYYDDEEEYTDDEDYEEEPLDKYDEYDEYESFEDTDTSLPEEEPATTVTDNTAVPAEPVPSTAPAAAEEATPSTAESSREITDNSFILTDYTIKITDYRVIPPGEYGNEDGVVPIIGFWFETTNTSGSEIDPSSAWIFSVTAFQDEDGSEYELNLSDVPDENYRDSESEPIESGSTVPSAISYELSNASSAVTLKIMDDTTGASIGQKKYEISQFGLEAF